MIKYPTLFLLLCCLTTYSQTNVKTPKKNTLYTLNLTLTPQLYLNGINVENDGIAPEAISTKNTGGYTIGAEIERKSRTGFLLNIGLLYGVRWHNITMGYEDLSFFDKGVAEELKKLETQKTYRGTSSYVKIRLMAGYIIPLKIAHGCNLEVKAGVSIRTYMTDLTADYYRGIQFERNDTIYISSIGSGYAHFGSRDRFQSWWKTAEGYIGFRKELDTKYLKHISVGLEFTKAIFFNGPSNNFDAYMDSYSLNTGASPISTDEYISRDFSIGLRLSVGLWHK